MRSDSSPRELTRVEQRRVLARRPRSSRRRTCRASRSGRAAGATPRAASAATRRADRPRRECASRSIQPLLRDGASDCAAAIARVRLAVGGDARAAACRRARRASCGRARARSARPSRRAFPSRSVVEVEELEPPGRLLVAAAAVRADDRQHGPDDLVAGHARDLPELVLRPPGTPRRAARCRRGRRASRGASPFFVGRCSAGGIVRLQPLERRIERRRARPPAARSGTAARRAGTKARTAPRRTPGRRCGSTGSRGTCPSGSNAGA